MSNSSILGGGRAARRAPGKDVDALGPSDSSDSGSDVQGEREMSTGAGQADELGALPVAGGSDSDARGTGERASATGRDRPDNDDITPDRVERGSAGMDDPGGADRLEEAEIDTLAADDEDPDPQEDLFEERRPRREPRHR